MIRADHELEIWLCPDGWFEHSELLRDATVLLRVPTLISFHDSPSIVFYKLSPPSLQGSAQQIAKALKTHGNDPSVVIRRIYAGPIEERHDIFPPV
ncbi:MAG: hypothetical protein AAFR38_14730 [Planctomycetota bacterium]